MFVRRIARSLRFAPRLALDAVVVAAAYLAIAIVVSWAAREPGWPDNHERLALFMRVESFRRAFAARDWLPLWTPFCFNGHGSPGPLFYHRFFNIFGGLLALKLGANAATRWMITAMIGLGAAGTHHAARSLGVSTRLRFAAGVFFALSPYVLTDWLVRGAVAELAAMALLPWFLSYGIRLSRGENVGLQMGLVAALMFHAHSMICFFALPIPVIACLVSVAWAPSGQRLRAWSKVLGAGMLFSLSFLLLTGPFLAAVYLLRTRVALGRLEVFNASRGQWVAWARYIADSYVWGSDVKTFSVEIGRGLVLLFVGTWFAALATRTRVRSAPVVMLAIVTAFYAFLQIPASASLYRAIPGGVLLQFPWRLVVMLVPAIALLTVAATHALISARRASPTVVGGAFAVVIAWQLLFILDSQKLTYSRFTTTEIETTLTTLDGPNNDEYLPVLVPSAPAPSPFFTLNGCVLAPGFTVPTDTPHLGRFAFWVVPKAPTCVVEFNQFCTPLLMVVTAQGTQSCSTRGLLTVTIPGGAPAYVRIQRRSLLTTIRELWRSRKVGT